MVTLYGKSIFKDVCIGRIYYYSPKATKAAPYRIDDPEREIQLYRAANEKAKTQLNELYDKTLKDMGAQNAAIFDAHRILLEDEEYRQAIEKTIEEKMVNAAYAIQLAGTRFAGIFRDMDSEYMKERAADVMDVTERLIKILLGGMDEKERFNEPVILAANDLTPSDMMLFPKDKLLGFILEQGSENSHTAILAKSMGVPALISVKADSLVSCDNKYAILDGVNGVVYIEPDEKTISGFNIKLNEIKNKKKELLALKGQESITLDGKKICLYANAGSMDDIKNAVENDAEGIGLFRSEFLYMEKDDFPTEQELFEAYKQVLTTMGGKRVIIRTLDIGADKKAPYFRLKDEENPVLGYRALRICLDRPEIFKTQLRALYRAGYYGNLSILIPMVISLEEIRKVKEIIKIVKNELKQENKPINDSIELGIMIETPAAALISDRLAKEVDFFSIGTNDLSQYTLAIDRQNHELLPFFDPRHEAIFKLIKMSVDAIHKEGKWAGICGELGADTEVTSRLLELGIDEFSVSPGVLLEVRKKIRESYAGSLNGADITI